ncbi:AAA family ATPase [Streptomyces sp. NPDC047974]|uniref:ATP-binding protein n=1 Tax=Streptomyces sp. NPDC047974 TaxID=3154343 RepID=UPI0033DB7571
MRTAHSPRTTGPAAPPPLLRLHLLGGFRVTRDGGPPLADRWPRPSAQALVKLLAVAPEHRLHRDQAVEACWPGADRKAALGSLRVALHAARRALEPELAPRAASSYLTGEGAMLRLEPDTVWVDVDHAERLAAGALEQRGVRALAEALAAFTGELLPEDRYADWAGEHRKRVGELRDRLRLAHGDALLDEGAAEDAADAAREILAASPAEERAHQLLISAYLRQGLRRQAISQFHACREVLDAELGVRPGPATERLHLLALDGPGGGAPSHRPSRVCLPPALRTPPPHPLHGRAHALAELLAPEACPVQLLGGEAGLGKTRLVTEAARRAADDGAVVLWGAGHDAEGHTPYGAFVEALDGWLADRPAAERARAGTDYPELAALLPSLGRTGSDAARSPEEERDRLFAATAALLRDLAATAPVLVVLDDLHAADTGSFQLLGHLARRSAGAWRFAVTYRPEELPEDDPRRAVLAALRRAGLARHVGLERLVREDCLALAADALGLPPGSPVPERVWDLSLGNPLFALELAGELREGGGSEAPRGVRELVAGRLSRLAPVARGVVEAVAIAGGHAALSEVLDVVSSLSVPSLSLPPAASSVGGPASGVGLTAVEAADGAEAAVSAAVLTERDIVVDGRTVDGLAFRHPLIRLTCYERLSAARRRVLHAAYADAVRSRRPDAVDTLAAHLSRADDPRATAYLRQAAERAAALCANDTADRYYAELTDRLDSLAAEAAWARIDRGAVLRRMGRYEEAAGVLREALAELRRRGDEDGLVLATGRLAEVLVGMRNAREGLDLLDALPPTAGVRPQSAAAHHGSRALTSLVLGRYEEAIDAAEAATACAQRVEGSERRALLARSLSLRATSLALAGRFAEAGPVAEEALPHAEAFGEPWLLGTVLSVRREQARRSGRLREAVATGRRALALSERTGDRSAVAFEQANLAELHLLLEETAEAAGLARAAEDAPLGWSTPYARLALARVLMRGGEGDPEALLRSALDVARDNADRQAQNEARTAHAEWLIRSGRPDEALAVLDRVTGHTHVTAWAHLAAGRPDRAAALARAEAERAALTGERIAEVAARTVHAAALAARGSAGEAAEAFSEASRLAGLLPCPAALRRIEEFRASAGR